MDAALPLLTVDSPMFPGLVINSDIEDSRNAALVKHLAAMPTAERVAGALAVRDGYEVGDRAFRSLYGVGVACAVHLGDQAAGRVTLTGQGRFRIAEMADPGREPNSFLTARISWLPERGGDDPLGTATHAVGRFHRYAAAVSAINSPGLHIESLPDDPTALSYLISAAVRLMTPQRQKLLESPDTTSRLADLVGLLDEELAVLAVLPSLPSVDIGWSQIAPN